MQKDSLIYVAGHRGLVGSAILSLLQKEGFKNILTKTHAELDLTDQKAVEEFFTKEKPEFVFFAAAKNGGMMAQMQDRMRPFYENLMMQTNVLHASHLNGVKKVLYLGSLCVYPKDRDFLQEGDLLKGELLPLNEPYGVAKIAGLKMCEFYNQNSSTTFIALAPTSIYGLNDNFDLQSSQVFPGIFAKIVYAKWLSEGKDEALKAWLGFESMSEIKSYLASFGISEGRATLLGTGRPKREFINADDVAASCLFAMQNINKEKLRAFSADFRNTHFNLASGEAVSIAEVANLIKEVVGFEGEICFDTSKPDGTLLKTTDTSRLKKLGFSAKVSLKEGVEKMYRWYITHTGGGGVTLREISLAGVATLEKAGEVHCA